MKSINLLVQVSTNANASDAQIAKVLQQLIDAGLADAAETVEQGEGDVETANLATSFTIKAPVVLSTYALDGKCHNAQPGTYGHECGKPATWIGEKAGGFTSGFCNACKEDGFEAKPVRNWVKVQEQPQHQAPTPAKLRVVLAGSLRHGFAIHAIVNEDDVGQQVIDLMHGGTLADDLEVQDPNSWHKNFHATPHGKHFAVKSEGVWNGLTVVGPFVSYDDAHAFVESAPFRSDDEGDWCILTHQKATLQQGAVV